MVRRSTTFRGLILLLIIIASGLAAWLSGQFVAVVLVALILIVVGQFVHISNLYCRVRISVRKHWDIKSHLMTFPDTPQTSCHRIKRAERPVML